METTRRRRQQGHKTHVGRDRENEILRVAGQIFYERGYAATTISDIANEVGLLKGSLYHYISSKEELLFRVIFDTHETSLNATRLKLVGLPVAEAIHAYIFESVLFVAQHPHESAVFYGEARHLSGEHLTKILNLRNQNEDLLRTLIRRGQEDGTVRGDIDSRLLVYYLIGPITSLPNWYRPEGAWPPAQVAEAYADTALAAVAASSVPDPPT